MGLLFVGCFILGLLCLVYYGVIIVYAGASTAFAWFWLLAGVGLLMLGFIIRYRISHELKLPELLRYVIFTVFTAGFCLFLVLEGAIIYHSTRRADPGVDYLIVLGAQVRGTTVSKSLKRRLDTASDYLLENKETRVIVSGGQGSGEDISEAEAMYRYLVTKGIAADRILKEDQSTNTEENIRYSRKLMDSETATVAVVTNGFHVFRSTGIAKKQGLVQIQGLAAPSDPILTVNYYIREAVGVLKDFVIGNLSL